MVFGTDRAASLQTDPLPSPLKCVISESIRLSFVTHLAADRARAVQIIGALKTQFGQAEGSNVKENPKAQSCSTAGAPGKCAI